MESEDWVQIGSNQVKFVPTAELRYERTKYLGATEIVLKQKWTAAGILPDGREHVEMRWRDIPIVDAASKDTK